MCASNFSGMDRRRGCATASNGGAIAPLLLLRLSGVDEGGGNKSEWSGRRMRLQVENIGSGFRPATARGLGGQSAVDARRHAAVDF